MAIQPSDQQTRSFDAVTVFSVLGALPLTALVAAVLVAPLRQGEAPAKPTAPVEATEKQGSDKSPPKGDDKPRPIEVPAPKASEPAGPPPKEVAAPVPPWQAALDQTGEPPKFSQVAFQDFATAFDRPGRDDLSPWFERTDGAGFRIGKIPSPHGKSGTIEGIGRLLSPWPADGVLRLALENFNRLRLHFFHGLEGVTLVYYEDQGYRWAAYATTREAGKPTPGTWAVTATDDDRCRRTELRLGGPIELRHRDGELILSRGDVVLLAAPLSAPPTDVFFEGRATIHGIALSRTIDTPTAPFPLSPAKELAKPAELAWSSSQSAAKKPEMQPDGSVRFAGDKLPTRAEWIVDLPKTRLHEVLLELSDVAPGSGVFFGREAGKSAEVIRFFRDRKSGQLAAGLQSDGDQWQGDFESPADQPTPLVARHLWLRLLYGCGNVRWWLSSDGVHWAQVEPAHDSAVPGVASIGVQLAANCPQAELTVKRILLRPLAGLTALVDPALVEKAPLIAANSPAEWHSAARGKKPADIEDHDWLRACSLRALGAGAERRLAYWLLEALLDDAAERRLPLADQLAALDDAMLLALDVRDGQAMRVGIFSRYAQLGIRAAGESFDGGRAWTLVRDHYHAAGAVTWMQLPTDLDRVVRHELVSSACRHQPGETLEFLQRLRFFHQHRQRPLVDWVESRFSRETRGRPSDLAGRMKDSWREPLVEELSKDTYNVLTELKAVLDGNSWDDAARLVTSFNAESASGFAPYLGDRAHLTSLPVALQLALEVYPQVRQALDQNFASLAKLRLAQAASAGNAAAIELASVQFAGTEAAANAHRWLGDRALVAGHFSRALAHYERAAAADPGQAGELAPRIRLTAAMLGRDAGMPVTHDVQFGDVSMSASDFESLVAEMKNRDGAAEANAATTERSPVPPPKQYETHLRSRLDEPVGERPQEETGRRTNQYRVDWIDRQLATAVHGDTMYVANHFQVAAYDLASGQRLWQSQPPPGAMQRAQEWALIPMRPLVVSDRIFVRLLYSPNPVLVCLERSSGKLLWVSENRDREFFVSDPLMVHGQLLALGILLQQDQTQLRHYHIDPRTGEILRHRDLVQLRNTWQARSCCELIEVEEGLVAVLGGFTIAIDATANIRWIRNHVALPADEDPRCVLQSYQRPIVQGGRIFLTQPGVRTVDCLDAATGRLYWSAILPEVIGLVGLTDDLLVVRTETEIRGLTRADGATKWRYAASHGFSFPMVDQDRLLIASRDSARGQSEPSRIRLTWLNAVDGKPTFTTLLPGLEDSDPRLGPLVPFRDRLFTFFGRGQHDPTRDVVELVPSREADLAEATNAWSVLSPLNSPPN